MQLTITARHFDLTNAIKDHIEESCEKLTKYFNQIINLHVTLGLQKDLNTVEISLHASHYNLQSSAEEHDMYLAIDKAIDKSERQLKKLKDKITDHQKKALRENIDFVSTSIYQKNKISDKKMIKTKRVVAEPMLIDDAVNMCLESNYNYFIFKNIETDRVNVIVEKDENHFRVLEP
ncbi:MAG: ribosome-associated translation inhibitor RaiA [Candidatus Cloacimonadota bacterium]|nr:ribosome-associated translation inhibitor RaiA [Candidatus Cloacimonadota bacterium]